MATFRRRKTKRYGVRWQALIRLKGHPPISQTFDLKTDAVEWAKGVEADLKRGYLQESLEADRHTFEEAVTGYKQDALPGITNPEKVEQMLDFWLMKFRGLTLAAISPAMVNTARRELLYGRQGSTVNRYVTALQGVFRYCMTERYWMKTNPAAGLPRFKEEARCRFLSEDERKALLEACRESTNRVLYPLVLTALTTGARQGELMAMRWEHVNLGKRRAYLYATKNGEARPVGLYGECLAVLTEMPKHISGYIFAGQRTHNRAEPPKFPTLSWQKARDASGVEDFRWHDCRHTAASYLAMSGATLHEIAAFLGHKSLANVQRYAHLSEEHVVNVSEKMVDRFLS